jgi:hypothetical protein
MEFVRIDLTDNGFYLVNYAHARGERLSKTIATADAQEALQLVADLMFPGEDKFTATLRPRGDTGLVKAFKALFPRGPA